MFQQGQTIDFASFGTTEELEGGDYDATVTAFEGGRAQFGDNPGFLAAQYTIDNGKFKGKTLTDEMILTTRDGDPNGYTFAKINTIAEKSGLDLSAVTWQLNPQDFAAPFQKALVAPGGPYRVRIRVGFDYKIGGEYYEVVNGKRRYWTPKDYDEAVAAGGDAKRYAKVMDVIGAPLASAEVTYEPKVPASVTEPAPDAAQTVAAPPPDKAPF